MGLGYDLNAFLQIVAQNSLKDHISLKTMSNCLDFVRLLMLKQKKDEYFELFHFRHYMQLHI